MMCRDIAKTTVTRFSHVVWLGIVQCLFNCLCYYSRATLGIKGTCPLTRGVRCHGSFCVTFRQAWHFWCLEHVIMKHFELSSFSIENRFLMTMHLWENCNFVSEVRMFGMCIGLEARYFCGTLLFWQVYRFRSPLLIVLKQIYHIC